MGRRFDDMLADEVEEEMNDAEAKPFDPPDDDGDDDDTYTGAFTDCSNTGMGYRE